MTTGSWLGAEPLLFPSLSAGTIEAVRVAYGVLLLATLVAALPHARRYFLSERWGGYGQSGWAVDVVQNPVVMPVLLAAWLAAAIAMTAGRAIVPALLLNLLLCRYFFIQMRWRGALRGMGAPGFIAYWLGAAVLLLEVTSRHAPGTAGLALLVLQVDFAVIMLSAGAYKLTAGYPQNHGMEFGMANPEWGYWCDFWRRRSPRSLWFRTFNQLAWSVEVVAAVLMLFPPTRFVGGMAILLSFVFIASQIRLGFLCEMVIVCCLLFAHPGSVVDGWCSRLLSDAGRQVVVAPWPRIEAALRVALWGYLLLLPLARVAMEVNFRARAALPGVLQRALEQYTNFFGMILWRVFSADVTDFFITISERTADGARRVITDWSRSLRYRQVAEAIVVTTVFTTLRYYPSNRGLFVERLLRYARTVPIAPGSVLVFEQMTVVKRQDHFAYVPATEFVVDLEHGHVDEKVIEPSLSLRLPAAHSPIHEGTRPGSYLPLGR